MEKQQEPQKTKSQNPNVGPAKGPQADKKFNETEGAPEVPKINKSDDHQVNESTRTARDREERQAGPGVPERDLHLPPEEKSSDIEPAKPYVPWL